MIFGRAYQAYLDENQIENLKLYKYSAVDKSPVTKYVMRHYWDFAITLFPEWIAPNLITFIGLLFMILNVLVIYIWNPDLGIEGPRWINFSFAAGLWLYSTFDNVDGRQARRTGTSSPLGELFDHGCDALNCTYIALLQASALGLGHSPQAAILLFVTIAGFHLSTSEEYYTGTLYLGYVNGPTEGILLTCLVFIWSGIFGASSWQVPLEQISYLSWITKIIPADTTFADLFIYALILMFLVAHAPVCILSIYDACKRRTLNVPTVAFNVFGPFTLITAFVCGWLASPYTVIFSGQHYILFALLIGLLFGEMASDIILAHLTKSRFPRFISIIHSLWVMSILVNIQPYLPFDFPEYEILVVLTLYTFTRYMIRAVHVINAFTKFLNIQCFTIPHTSSNQVPSRTVEQEIENLIIAEEGGSNRAYNTF
ncbi:CDP-alcohol phosphatidyltransferase-domain-containing protein [Pilobolus umbonatus]|nr:CDP-alcohol phosphatidyltransferase-domain-containing protein [Pilobolus umbonatus]